MQFWSDGSRNRPWLLIVITDGMENSVGGNYRKTGAAGIGRFIAERYNHSDSNFISVIGVGEDNEIDKKSLGTMGYYGNFPAMTIEAFPLLERLFIEIALQVSEKLEGIQINYGNLSWTEVSRVRQISTIPFDYAFLIDRSGSMSDEG